MPGIFQKKVYLANDLNGKYAISIQPETQLLVFDGRSNPDAGNDFTGRSIIVTNASRKARRPTCRSVTFRFTGAVPVGYKPNSVIRLPWLRPEGFDQLSAGKTGTYQGFPVVVVGRREERIPLG